MVPTKHTEKALKSLPSEDLTHLHSLPLVDTTGLGNYALSDLVLEMNVLLDHRTIQNIQEEVYVDYMKYEWGLPPTFSMNERRNKEIDLVMGEIEEKAYRFAGKLQKYELEGLKEMYKIKRGDGVFDKAWVSSVVFQSSFNSLF